MKKLLPLFLCLLSLNVMAQYANGKIKIYFDRAVDNAVQGNYPAVQLWSTWGDTLAAYIDRANISVDVACYDFTESTGNPSVNNVATAINSAYSRGVVVRWIYNGSSSNTGLTLLNSGIKTLASPQGTGYNIMHDKFVVIDAGSTNTDAPVVWTGSPDWSQEMLDSDYNNIIIFQDQPLAKAYTAQFNQMWGGTGSSPVTANEKFGSHKADLGPHIFTIGGSEVELYFSPTDSTNDHILDVINSANSQLFFGVYTFTESADATAIVARKNAGVITAGVVDSYSYTFSATPILTAGLGNMVKEYVEPPNQPWCLYHNKYVIADACDVTSDPQVLTGSHNWTSSADEENDENTVIIHNADVANIYYQAFIHDFDNIGTNNQLTPCVVSNPCANAVSANAAVVSNVSCSGQSNGSAVVHASGSNPPFTFKWSSSPAQTDSVLSNVAAGSYTVTVTNSSSCTATASVTISAGVTVGVSVTETNPTCNGQLTGTATATGTGGTSPYSYAWSTSPGQQTAAATGLGAGTYTVSVTDHNGCSISATATITQPSAINISGSVTNESCLNGSNGNVTVTVTGGAGNYQYLWNTTPQQSAATISNIIAGGYTVTVTDGNNCTANKTFTVTQPNSGLSLTTSTNNASCGSSNGSATVSVSGSTGSLTYSWNGGGNTATYSNLAAGNYSVTVSETGGCSATAGAIVNSAGGPSVVASSANTTCGNSNGSATVSVSGGATPYTYNWSNGGTAISISNLSSGNFSVTVDDNNGCESIANVNVAASNGLVLNITSTAASCSQSNGTATVTVSNGTSPTYAWSNGATTAGISNLNGGTVSVTVSDVTSCTASASVTVGSGSGGTQLTVTTDKNNICQGDSAHICANTGFNTYLWSSNQSTSCIYAGQTGNYVVTAVDNNGCSSISTPVIITVYPPPVASFGTNGDTLIATSGSSYQWYLNGNTIGSAINEEYVVAQPGNYSVQVTDANGCTATSTSRYINPTGINNITTNQFINVYPNPLQSGNWQLEVSNDWLGSNADLYDASGKAVLHTEIKNLKTELQINIAQGIYLLKVTGNGRSMVKKLVKL
jgi:hypothetical protein